MRFFTDKDGNFNWAAVGGVCAGIGTVIAVVTFVSPYFHADATAANHKIVFEDYVAGDKIEGITLEQYEQGLKRREEEVIAKLKQDELSNDDAKVLRQALQRIDARQADIQRSYKDAKELTAEIRANYQNAETPGLVNDAIDALFDGDTANAARLSIKAGLPITSVGTVESLGKIFQPIDTERDFLRFVAGRELVPSDNQFYHIVIGRDGSLNGFNHKITRSLTGSWSWRDGQYCEEYSAKGKHVPETCLDVFATTTAVKFVKAGGKSEIWSKR